YRNAQRQFDATRVVDVAADAIQFRSITTGVARVLRIGRHTYRSESFGTTVDDTPHARNRLDVVYNRWPAERSFHCRERRFNPRAGAFAFQTLDQSGFLAADVRSRTAMQENVEMKVLAENVAAKQIVIVKFINCLLQDAITTAIFITQIQIRRAGPRRIARQNDPFENLMRILFHQDAIVKRTRFALVGVDAHINGTGMIFG